MSSATNTNSSSRLRTLWRIAIVLLWMGTGIAIFFSLRSTGQQSGENGVVDNSNEQQPIVLTPQENNAPVSLDEQWDPAGIGDFNLTESSGRTITNQDLLGKN